MSNEATPPHQSYRTDQASTRDAVTLAVQKFNNRLDGVVLNHGTLDPLGRIASLDISQVSQHLNTNVVSLVSVLQITLPQLRASPNGGKVIFISSGAATGGTEGWGAYNAGKAAVNALCRTLASEEPKIVSVALRPGKVDTDMQLALRETGKDHMSTKDHAMFVDAHSQGKLVKPEDVGYCIASLSLNATPSLSGQFVSWDADPCKDFRRK